jgi:hypothetical protein
MLRVCPRCRGTSHHFLCPRCGTRTDDTEAPANLAPAAAPAAEAAEPLSAGTGLFMGLLLAQGLYYALRHLVTALLLAAGDPAAEAEYWAGFHGLVTQHTLQTITLLLGGMIAGAGQKHGLVIGVTLGAANAILLMGLPALAGQLPNELLLIGQPLLHMVVGAAGGYLGSRVWQQAPPVPTFADPRANQERLTTMLPDQPTTVVTEPLPWVRIILGTAVAAGGTLGARLIRDFVLAASGGLRGSAEIQRSQFITWEISVLAQVIGGGLAGAATRSGGVHGFWVGMLASAIMVTAQSFANMTLRSHEFTAWLIGLPVPEGSPAALVIQGVQAVALAALGGWLGALILPVIEPKPPLDAGAHE